MYQSHARNSRMSSKCTATGSPDLRPLAHVLFFSFLLSISEKTASAVPTHSAAPQTHAPSSSSAARNPASESGSYRCWQIRQESCTIGKVHLVISDKAVLWTCTKYGLTLLFHSPDWHLLAYNDSNKKYMEVNADQIQKMVNQHRQSRRLRPGFVDQVVREQVKNSPTICGVRTIEYRVKANPEIEADVSEQNQSRILQALTVKNASLPSKKPKSYDPKLWRPGDEDWIVAADIVMPQPVVKVFSKLFDVSDVHPLLRSVHIGYGGSTALTVDTSECKRIDCAKSMFTVPPGYMKTTNEMALLTGIDDSDMDMLSDPVNNPAKNSSTNPIAKPINKP